jgi:hypothetical protein
MHCKARRVSEVRSLTKNELYDNNIQFDLGSLSEVVGGLIAGEGSAFPDVVKVVTKKYNQDMKSIAREHGQT